MNELQAKAANLGGDLQGDYYQVGGTLVVSKGECFLACKNNQLLFTFPYNVTSQIQGSIQLLTFHKIQRKKKKKNIHKAVLVIINVVVLYCIAQKNICENFKNFT